MSLKEQRAARIEQIKEAIREGILKNPPPGLDASFKVELHPDAAIDLFGMEVLDAPQDKFEEFLNDMRTGGEMSPVDEDEIPEEVKERLRTLRRDK